MVVELSVQIIGHMLDILSGRFLAIFLFKYFVGVWDFGNIEAVIIVLGSINRSIHGSHYRNCWFDLC